VIVLAAELRTKPAGNVPAVTVNVQSGVPLADTDADTARPTLNGDASELDTIVGATAASTVPEKVADAEPPAFVAVIAKLYGPAVVGTPSMTPVTPLREMPEGNVPVVTANVGTGDPSAVTCANE
jgi:hypothetical protein